jgi:hypothetical protein
MIVGSVRARSVSVHNPPDAEVDPLLSFVGGLGVGLMHCFVLALRSPSKVGEPQLMPGSGCDPYLVSW